MIKAMSDNDDARAGEIYDGLIARGVDENQFAAARLQIGVVNTNTDYMNAQWHYVKHYYYADAVHNGYLPDGLTEDSCSLQQLREYEAAFYGDTFPP